MVDAIDCRLDPMTAYAASVPTANHPLDAANLRRMLSRLAFFFIASFPSAAAIPPQKKAQRGIDRSKPVPRWS
jgi:hypothetical protein